MVFKILYAEPGEKKINKRFKVTRVGRKMTEKNEDKHLLKGRRRREKKI